MGKLLTVLGVTETNIGKDVLQAEELILGLQEIYQNSPESPKKNKLANAIAEAIRLLMKQIREEPLQEEIKEQKQTPQVINVGDIFYDHANDFAFKVKKFTYRAGKNIAEVKIIVMNGLKKEEDIEIDQTELEDDIVRGAFIRANQFTVGDKVTLANQTNSKQADLTISDVYNTDYTIFYYAEDGKITISFGSQLLEYEPIVEVGKRYTLVGDKENTKNYDTITKIERDGYGYILSYFNRVKDGVVTPNLSFAVDNFDFALLTGQIKEIEEEEKKEVPKTNPQNKEIQELANWFVGKTLNLLGSKQTITFMSVEGWDIKALEVEFDTITKNTRGNPFNLWTVGALTKLKNGERVNDWEVAEPEDDDEAGSGSQKNITGRKSPSVSANSVKEGTIMVGNDGNDWKSVKTAAGYQQWRKI